ncbi:MAG TPA: SpaH/EbpB family LPXTG-anchored major pilin [Candidatus Mediterraneibacter caccogallinarum]|nr:SpaH/EbpB family LPXTG-anchored major pilin [Candidatus Mediterraneibacter caccogallinarum]
MRKVKKLLGLLLAAVMVFAMGTTAFADEKTHTITAPNNGHTYEVYQIFKGDYSEGDNSQKVLSNVKWGKNGTGTQGDNVSEEILTELKNANGSDTEQLAVIKKYANLQSSDKFGTVTYESPLEVPSGYYLIKDEDGSQENEQDSYTLYIVQVVGENITIAPKAGVPESEKKVDDKNDSNTTEDEESWQDSADYDIGDHVPYQLTATLPDNVSNYTSYTLKFVDTMSRGLTYDADSAEVFVNGKSAGKLEPTSANYSGDDDRYTDGTVLTWNFDNIKAAPYNAGNNAVITIKYTAKLNNNAVMGSAGNPNKMHIEFSNNPNGEGTGKTPDDTNIVFTYKVVVNKVDEDKKPLAGAQFTLQKKQANGSWEDIGSATVSENQATFTFSGLDDGDYKLSETKTPDGYNDIADIVFTITAEHDIVSNDPRLTSLTGDTTTGEITFTPNTSNGSLTTDVENKSGAELPETGGMGTTIFYVLGAILVIGAGVLLIARRRTDSEK